MLFATPARALAEPTVTIVPLPTVGEAMLTGDPRPTIGIEASEAEFEGEQIQCSLDFAAPGPCGPPLAGCKAVLCASYTPAAPLADGEHDFVAGWYGSNGGLLLSGSFLFTVDTTPPKVRLERPTGSPWEPSFVDSVETAPAIPVTAHLECSLTPLGGAPTWSACKENRSGELVPPGGPLPRARRNFSFWFRATDQLGHSSAPARVDFNPVPCTVKARPVSIGALLAKGLPVRVNCSFSQRDAANVYFVYRNGSPVETEENPVLGFRVFKRKKDQWQASGRLPVQRALRSSIAHYRKLPIRIYAVPSASYSAGAYGKFGEKMLTLSR
jgi:hypothetical protein